jgi:tetratricopeptide (TPR) repeat protein
VLPKADSLMIAAELAPTYEQRYALYERAVRKDPFGAIAPLQYGSDLFHRGPLAGLPLDSGVALLRLARERDRTLAEVHDQLMWALIRLGERDSAEAALRALVANARATRDVHPDVFRLVAAMRFGPEERVLPLLEDVGSAASEQVAQRVRLALAFDLAPYQAIIGGRLAAGAGVSFGMRTHGRIAMGLALLTLGRPDAGLSTLDSAVALGGHERLVPALQSAQWRVLAPALGIAGASDSDEAAAAARSVLERAMDDSAVGGRAAWTLALDAWHRGDTAAARALAGRIPTRDDALRVIVAAVDSGRRSPPRALALTAGLRGVNEEQDRLGDPFARAIMHLRRAEWYDAIGESENAERELRWHENSDFIGWLQGSIQSAEVDWVAGAYVRVREGMRRVDAGDRAACADLRRVVDTLWIDVEPGVESLRDAGRAKARVCP